MTAHPLPIGSARILPPQYTGNHTVLTSRLGPPGPLALVTPIAMPSKLPVQEFWGGVVPLATCAPSWVITHGQGPPRLLKLTVVALKTHVGKSWLSPGARVTVGVSMGETSVRAAPVAVDMILPPCFMVWQQSTRKEPTLHLRVHAISFSFPAALCPGVAFTTTLAPVCLNHFGGEDAAAPGRVAHRAAAAHILFLPGCG